MLSLLLPPSLLNLFPWRFCIIDYLIEEMRVLSKLTHDHKKLVLGCTGKHNLQKTKKENNDFDTLLRSCSLSKKVREAEWKKRMSLQRLDKIEVDNEPQGVGIRKSTLRLEIQQHHANFRTQVQKKQKLVLQSCGSSTPLRGKGKQNLVLPQRLLFEPTELHGFELNALEMVTHLKQHGVLFGPDEANFIIRKEHLIDLFSNVIDCLVRTGCRERVNPSTCATMNAILSKLTDKVQKHLNDKKREKMSLRNEAISLRLKNCLSDQEKRLQSRIGKIVEYALKENKLQESIEKLTHYEETIRKECDCNRAMIDIEQRQLDQLKLEVQREMSRLTELKQETQRLERDQKMYQQLDQKVKNYVNEQQNNKIIKDIFEQYKQTQADLYEYAAYLQSNQLASDLYYEPHPFRAIEEQIQTGLREVNTTLIQHQELSIHDKSVLMRDFVLDSMGKFKKKDEEMGKVNEFRVKCIREYIEKMKKWLGNWEFKQEFLVGLRKEFACDAEMMMEGLAKLAGNEEIKRVGELARKIVENYKMGNAFY